MLRVRVLSAAVALVLLFMFVFSGRIVLGAGIFILALIGMYEFYNSVSNIGIKPVRIIGYLSCTPLLLIGLNPGLKASEFFRSVNYLSFGIFVIVVVLLTIIIFLNDRYNINDIALTAFGILYVTFLFSFIPLTRNMEKGFYFVWLIFIGAFSTDTFAYFTGRFLGRHKLLPAISPKKTVEGAVGGIIGCVAVTVIYGMCINELKMIPIYQFIILGVLNGIISQIGDWAASAIKRYVKIKDYGNIMPGHGGVLDRFDSILFTAPVVYFYIRFIVLKM